MKSVFCLLFLAFAMAGALPQYTQPEYPPPQGGGYTTPGYPDKSPPKGLQEALQKLFATAVNFLRYAFSNTCANLAQVLDRLYDTIDCIFEIADLDVCRAADEYDCNDGLQGGGSPGSPGSPGYTPSRSKRIIDKLGLDLGGGSPKSGGGSPYGGNQPNARVAPLLIIILQEIVRVLSHILGAPWPDFCDRTRLSVRNPDDAEYVCASYGSSKTADKGYEAVQKRKQKKQENKGKPSRYADPAEKAKAAASQKPKGSPKQKD